MGHNYRIVVWKVFHTFSHEKLPNANLPRLARKFPDWALTKVGKPKKKTHSGLGRWTEYIQISRPKLGFFGKKTWKLREALFVAKQLVEILNFILSFRSHPVWFEWSWCKAFMNTSQPFLAILTEFGRKMPHSEIDMFFPMPLANPEESERAVSLSFCRYFCFLLHLQPNRLKIIFSVPRARWLQDWTRCHGDLRGFWWQWTYTHSTKNRGITKMLQIGQVFCVASSCSWKNVFEECFGCFFLKRTLQPSFLDTSIWVLMFWVLQLSG